jgi:hypothetical protein
LRAGPLSNDKLIETLNAEFVNTWMIIPEFKKPEQFFEDPVAREWAKVIAGEFTYPVDSIVLSSAGKPLAQGKFQELRSSATAYLKLVKQATIKLGGD